MALCSGCMSFEYDEIWDGTEEIELWNCKKGHFDHIGWNMPPCEDFEEDDHLLKGK